MTALPLSVSGGSPLAAKSHSAPVFDDLPPARLFKVPDVAPPFDGELSPEPPPCGVGHDSPRVPSPRTPIPLTEMARGNGAAGPGDWPPRFARLLAEVLSGLRPARQLTPWLTQRARCHLRGLTPAFSTGQGPRVLRVMVSQPSAAAVEMSVVIGLGTRTRALALRLERAALTDQPVRWLCTDIEAA